MAAADSAVAATGKPNSSAAELAINTNSRAPWLLYQPWQRWGLLTILFLVTTSNYFDYFIASVLLDPIKHEFQVSDTMLGLLSGFCFALVYGVAGLPIARWADRGNRRTVITIALVGWSGMTALGGLARTFWQLTMSRFGVGIMEPGAAPAAQSLIADYFPPGRRATALAIVSMGASAAGYLFGVGLGGYVAATEGWRSALLFAGLSGLALALVARLTLSEPRCLLGFPAASVDGMESICETLARLRRKRSFVLALLGISISTIFASAVSMFIPSFMIRSLHSTLRQVSGTWAIAISAADLIGALGGGWLADRLSSRDIRWYAWLPTIGSILAIPMFLLAFAARHLWSFIALDCLAEVFLSLGVPAVFAAIHVVCGNRRRATAIAIVQLSYTLIGMGIGPLAAGSLSDLFASRYGVESLRYSLIMMLTFLVPAATSFYFSGRAMLREQEAS